MDQSIEWGDEDDDTDWSQMIDLELEIQKSPTQPRKKHVIIHLPVIMRFANIMIPIARPPM